MTAHSNPDTTKEYEDLPDGTLIRFPVMVLAIAKRVVDPDNKPDEHFWVKEVIWHRQFTPGKSVSADQAFRRFARVVIDCTEHGYQEMTEHGACIKCAEKYDHT
jgi:hypothetical protein